MQSKQPTCKCGCGDVVAPGRTWRKGHHWRGRKRGSFSAAHREKLADAARGNTHRRGKPDAKGSAAKRGKKNPCFGKKGADHPRWQGGRWVDGRDGYVFVHAPGHPRARSNGYVREHILVMEKKLGRLLEPDEIVHHINGDKQNNRRRNLWLCTQATHRLAHHSAFELVCELLDAGVVRFDRRSGKYRLVDEAA